MKNRGTRRIEIRNSIEQGHVARSQDWSRDFRKSDEKKPKVLPDITFTSGAISASIWVTDGKANIYFSRRWPGGWAKGFRYEDREDIMEVWRQIDAWVDSEEQD